MEAITSEYLESLEIEELETITEDTFRYQLTQDEQDWLSWIGDRCAVSAYLAENTDENGITTLDAWEISEALTSDGVDRPSCLSEDTQLCRLIWFIGPR